MPSQTAYRYREIPLLVLLAGLCAIPCSADEPAQLRATRYEINARLNPPAHRLEAQAVITLAGAPNSATASTGVIEFGLNRALQVEQLEAQGARLRAHTTREPNATEPNETPLVQVHRLELENLGPTPVVTFRYAGELVQDVQAGEKRGQVHNVLMAAHVAPEGIYLDEGGGWYPFVYTDSEQPRGEAAEFKLAVEPVAGMRLVASAEPDQAASQHSGKLVWHSKYPLGGLVLVGGAHEVKQRQLGPLQVELHYSLPADPQSRAQIEKFTDLFLDAADKYLKRYEPLVGPYPYAHYTIVENFFSSGFAFPEFTLLNKALFAMGPRGLGHGMLDHEMLHSWWGNTVYVDPADGNWCEALTSYCTNYYGYVLDGDEKAARNQRRNFCVAVSRMPPEEDKPLGLFGRTAGEAVGASREVGYSKGALVFYMLAQQIGQDKFWAACRRLTHDYAGRFADWKALQAAFEAESGQKLDAFFQQWVRKTGTPEIRLEAAAWQQDRGTLDVTLAQGAPPFALRVPLRLVGADGAVSQQVAELTTARATVPLKLEKPPQSVVLDPDYEMLRRLRADEIVPGIAGTRAGRKLLIVKPAAEVPPFYQRVIEDFSGEPGEKQVTLKNPAEVTAADLAGQAVLVLGAGVRNPAVHELLQRAKCPLTFDADPARGFRLDDQAFDKPGNAVLCSLHHPDVPGAGITLYYGNADTALGRSDLLLHYRDSLVVFDTTSRAAEGTGSEKQTVYESKVVARRDFEFPTTIEVKR